MWCSCVACTFWCNTDAEVTKCAASSRLPYRILYNFSQALLVAMTVGAWIRLPRHSDPAL